MRRPVPEKGAGAASANVDPARKCMDAALHLLKFRGRSEKEMADRLRTRKFEADVIAATVARLVELNLVNDEALAKSWIESGRRSGWGEQRLKQALWKRGLPRTLTDRLLAEAPVEGAATESDRAREALERRLKRMPIEGVERGTLYRKLGGYLARQGFSPDVVHETLNSFLNNRSVENF